MAAVEWLATEFYEKLEVKGDGALFNDLVNQAKEIEKQQIIDTYRDGRSDQQSERPSRFYNRNAEFYYNEKFNK